MTVWDYYRQVLMPANTAVSAMRRFGLPVDRARVYALMRRWERELRELEREVEAAAAARGIALTYSDRHQPSRQALLDFLYSAAGLGLDVYEYTPTGQPSASDEALLPYASLSTPWASDIPVVRTILKIRSLAKALGTYLQGFVTYCRADGAVHPKWNWAIVRTARLSASEPAVQQIPERSDPEVAREIRRCLVARHTPVPEGEEWDPRRHGSCVRFDIAGAEAVIRGGMLTHRFCSAPEVLWEYLRAGKDVHGRTAALLYDKPEGTFRKGDPERDIVGKQVFFGKLYGGTWRTVQRTLWTKARIWIPDEEARRLSDRFDAGYPRLRELYEHDKAQLGTCGFVEDGYGRRRRIPLPDGVRYLGRNRGTGRTVWRIEGERGGEAYRQRLKALEHAWHVAANTPTQGMSATDCLWMVALLYHGEYVPLAVPPMWEGTGVLFPEVRDVRFDGRGIWISNMVHDSVWLDCAPGMLETAVKTIVRRCTALPFDWRLAADVPYRIEVECGPNFGDLRPYAAVAKQFGMAELLDR